MLMSYGTILGDTYRQAGALCRLHSQGREAGRSAGGAADQVRTSHQPQDRRDARPRRATELRARRLMRAARSFFSGSLLRCRSPEMAHRDLASRLHVRNDLQTDIAAPTRMTQLGSRAAYFAATRNAA